MSRQLHPAGTSEEARRRGARRLLGVEANARLTAITGLVLVIMFAAEGITILSIRPLISWHAAIGLAIIPVVGVKLGSTMWRFGRYYGGDVRYRAAGPPHPILRILGPFAVICTVAVLATGIVAWVMPPHQGPWVSLHKASFIVWIAVMAVHVLGHLVESLRLARGDIERRTLVPFRPLRMAIVAGSICAGVALGFAARGLDSGWAALAHVHFH